MYLYPVHCDEIWLLADVGRVKYVATLRSHFMAQVKRSMQVAENIQAFQSASLYYYQLQECLAKRAISAEQKCCVVPLVDQKPNCAWEPDAWWGRGGGGRREGAGRRKEGGGRVLEINFGQCYCEVKCEITLLECNSLAQLPLQMLQGSCFSELTKELWDRTLEETSQ